MSVLSITDVHKTYNPGLFKKKVQAVRGLSLDVAAGEVFGLIGPNGAGKSSTIRLLLGLSRPDKGTVLVKGEAPGRAEVLRQIGYLPENPYLYDNLSLRHLLEFCAGVTSLSSADREARIDRLLKRLDMAAVQNRPMRTYSKGMLQRAGICFALLHDPEIVILDEPMSGLDPIGRKLVFDIVMELKEEGKTIFFCSHILSDVERLCDRIGLLNKGVLVRTFERSDFSAELGFSVHLRLGALSREQKEALSQRGVDLQQEGEGHIVSTSGARLAETAQILATLGVPIVGSRSERISLEELFVSAIQGGAQ